MAEDLRGTRHSIISLVALLSVVGIIMVFSTTMTLSEKMGENDYILRQIFFVLIGFSAMMLFSVIDYHIYRKMAIPIIIVAFALLGLVLVPGVGTMVNGARRWLRAGGIGFQPSEFAKLAVIIFTAHFISRRGDGIRRFLTGFVPPMAVAGAAFVIILLEPDFGTGALIGGIVLIMLIVGGAHWIHVLLSIALACPGFYYLIAMSPYRRSRFFAFLNPWKFPDTAGYHIIQSLIAIGSGGLFGLGLGASRQKLFFLPEATTDFIFAIICEELGFVGAIIVIGLYLLLLKKGIKVCKVAKDSFGFFLAFGIITMIIMQAATNIAVVTASVPTKGISLPFISFGGSSLIVMMTGIGIVLNVCRQAEAELLPEELKSAVLKQA